jgi:hypothetical protein
MVLEGRFDAVKLQAKAEQIARDMPNLLKIGTVAGSKMYSFSLSQGSPFHVVQLDKTTMMITKRQDHLETALARMAGKKKPNLKHQALRPLLAQLKPDQAIGAVALKETIVGTMVSVTFNMGQQVRTVKHNTLGESGIDSVHLQLSVAEEIKGLLTMNMANPAGAANLARIMTGEMKTISGTLAKQAANQKELAALAKVIEAVQIKTKDAVITLEGQGGADAIQGMILGLFWVQAPPRPVPDR